jgi:hypothetical protein
VAKDTRILRLQDIERRDPTKQASERRSRLAREVPTHQDWRDHELGEDTLEWEPKQRRLTEATEASTTYDTNGRRTHDVTLPQHYFDSVVAL